MKNGLFSRLKDKFDGLNPREKWLLKIALAVIMLVLIDRLLISPVLNYDSALTSKTGEQIRKLADIKNYLNHKELQKDLYRGKTSDFLAVFMQAAADSKLGTIELKKTENSEKGILVSFEAEGDIQKILNFILIMEKMNFVVLFQKTDIVFIRGSDYHFEGQIQVIKG